MTNIIYEYISYVPPVDSFIALCFPKAPDPGRQDLYEEVGRENIILMLSAEFDKIKSISSLYNENENKIISNYDLINDQGGEQLLNLSPPLLSGKKVNGDKTFTKDFKPFGMNDCFYF